MTKKSPMGMSAPAYDAVLRLRRAGHRVYCAKRVKGIETHHALDGEIVPTSWMIDMARLAPAEAANASR